jgi:hypothetical protein
MMLSSLIAAATTAILPSSIIPRVLQGPLCHLLEDLGSICVFEKS